MRARLLFKIQIVPLLLLFLWMTPIKAEIFVQCPGDTDGDGISEDSNIVCMHITGGDGFSKMADGTDMYIFSFGNAAGVPIGDVIATQTLKALAPAPRIELKQGQELYLTMSNVGMIKRPDLFDPHSVHWHGFPNAAPIFDGLPEPSPTANMGSSLTYYYKAAVPGTYFYHCHVEAAEHMQMGMIGNLWVHPAQSFLLNATVLGAHIHINNGDANVEPFDDFPGPGDVDLNSNGQFDEGVHDKYVYNDGDGSTLYHVDYPIQLTGFDSLFHTAHIKIQALPFAAMYDDYPVINGRGYPDTINPNNIVNQEGFDAQRIPTRIIAALNQRILLRVSNVSTTHLYTIATTLGVPMKVVGRGAALLRGPDGKDTSFEVSVLNVGGGQAFDVILDTTGVAAGTYLLYTTNLANLSNGPQERGGIMTEIVIETP